MLESLRAEVLEANLELVRRGLVIYTFGNASGISREQAWCVIKPSGVPYEKMTPGRHGDHGSGGQRRGRLAAAVFRPGHARRALPRISEIGGVVHTHSRHATPGRRPVARFPASAPRMPITSTAGAGDGSPFGNRHSE